MIKAIIWIFVGICIIIYNHFGAGGRLIIRWTSLDLGYLVIAYGVIIMIREMILKRRQEQQGAADDSKEV